MENELVLAVRDYLANVLTIESLFLILNKYYDVADFAECVLEIYDDLLLKFISWYLYIYFMYILYFQSYCLTGYSKCIYLSIYSTYI